MKYTLPGLILGLMTIPLFVIAQVSSNMNVRAQSDAVKGARETIILKRADSDSLIKVIFNHRQTFDDLVLIKNDLAKKDIFLQYRSLGFDEEGKLVSIAFKVGDSKAGGSDTASDLTDESTIGFFFDYSQKAKFRFGAGDLKRMEKTGHMGGTSSRER
jgi:hypothetical protein